MSTKKEILITFVVALTVGLILGFFLIHRMSKQDNSTTAIIPTSDVVVDSPLPDAVVTSPLAVQGRARGNWYFEANLPAELLDANGNVIAQKGFHAIGNWETTDFVDFADTLTFTVPTTQTGVLKIHNDNPSGDPANDKVFMVPVKFW